MNDTASTCRICQAAPDKPCNLRDGMRQDLCPRDDPNAPPSFTISAQDPEAPAILRALAAKVRPTDLDRAAAIDREAGRFEAWRRLHLRTPR